MPTIAEKRSAFRRLHERGCFVIPNPWDIGTARYLQHLHFKALATTSAGAAFSLGRPDNETVTRDDMLAHIKMIVEASDLPVNADYESGYAHEPAKVAENVRLCVETGVAGLSIEDNSGDRANPLYDLDLAVARIRAARAAIDKSGADVLLTGRAECFLVGRPNLQEAIERLVAYAAAGADCLYAPGIKSRDEIAAVVLAVAPKPVNVLVGARERAHRRRSCNARRAPHQRRQRHGARRLGRFHPRRARHCRAGPLRRLRRRRAARGAEPLLPRGLQAEAGMSMAAKPVPAVERPVGPPVDATPATRPGPVVLQGRFGRVEKLDATRHGKALWNAVKGHDQIWTYMSAYGPFSSEAAFSDWLAARATLEDPFSYAIVDASDRAVGIATLMEIRPAMRVCEVGHIVYSPALQQTPLATEAQYLLARHVFETLGYRRYEWKCNALNEPSRRAALRLGFVFEGILRQHMIAKGRNRDTAYYSMLDGAWPRCRAAFERWLAPENFDGNGRQHRRLEEIRTTL